MGEAVSRILSRVIILLGDLLPDPSGGQLWRARKTPSIASLGLASDRVYNAPGCPECDRLSKPNFSAYLSILVESGMVSVALSVALRRPAVNWCPFL